jgi:hypothetical protein
LEEVVMNMYYPIRFQKVFFALLLVLLSGRPVFGAAIGHHDIISRYSYMVAADGLLLGDAYKVEGGAITATVGLKTPPGGVKMHPDLILADRNEHSIVTIQFTAIYPALAEWMNTTWDDGDKAKTLRIACISPEGTLVWDRTCVFAQIKEVVIQEGVSALSTTTSKESVATRPGVFIVKIQCADIADSTGSFPADSGSVPGRISIGYSKPNIALDGMSAFTPVAVEPISIMLHIPIGRGPGTDPADRNRTIISNIVTSVPFAFANGLLSWAKTWLSTVGSSRAALVEKNGTMRWMNDMGETTCTISLKNVGVCGYEYTSDSETNPLAKVSLYCEEAKLLLPGAATPGGITPAVAEKDPTLETRPKSVGPTKSVALRSSGAALGTFKKFGPFELVIKSVDYLTTPLLVAGNDLSPTADQKLFVVTYTLRNPSAEMQLVDSGTAGFQAFDVSGATYQDFKVGIGAKMAGISGSSLIQDDILSFSAAIIIPAEESIAKLRITCPSDGSMVEYKFESGE